MKEKKKVQVENHKKIKNKNYKLMKDESKSTHFAELNLKKKIQDKSKSFQFQKKLNLKISNDVEPAELCSDLLKNKKKSTSNET
jgi:hypothetical protein